MDLYVSGGKGPKWQSPTFFAPGTGFMEDNFSMDQGGAGVARSREGWFQDETVPPQGQRGGSCL